MLRGRPKKLIESIDKKLPHPNSKTPFLQQHSAKMQQKLSYLKQKISQKKRISTANKTNTAMHGDLSIFLNKYGLTDYLNKLVQNGIDSYLILKQVKQVELEEIGFTKGHALKTVVSIKREEQAKHKAQLKNKQSSKSTFDNSITQKQSIETQQKVETSTANDIQTESIPLDMSKKLFCLYCFSRSQFKFCTQKCENQYNGMFQRYQRNLQKAEEEFIVQKPQQILDDDQEFIHNFDFLFEDKAQNIDKHQYQQIQAMLSDNK